MFNAPRVAPSPAYDCSIVMRLELGLGLDLG